MCAIIATSVGADNVPSLLNNASYGVKLSFPMGNSFIQLELLLFVGPFGNPKTKHVLTRN